MAAVEVKFGEWIQKGFDIWKANLGVLILANLIVAVLSGLTLGILAGPMAVGLILIVFRLVDGSQPKPAAGDVFQGFQKFLPSFLLMLTMAVAIGILMLFNFIPCVGTIIYIAGIYAVMTFLMFAMYLIADRNLDFMAAIKESAGLVKQNFWMFLVLMIVTGIISGLGAIACGIGVIVTAPLGVTILAVAYRELFSGVSAAPQPSQPQAPTPGA